MGNGLDRDREAYWLGYGSHVERMREDANPYEPGTVERESWLAGWIRAYCDQKGPKPWWTSKTLWLGAVTFVVSAAALSQQQLIATHPAMAAGAGIVIGAAVITLRAVTGSRSLSGVWPKNKLLQKKRIKR